MGQVKLGQWCPCVVLLLQRCFVLASTVVTYTHKLMTSSVRVHRTATDRHRWSAKMVAASYTRGQTAVFCTQYDNEGFRYRYR